MDVSGHVMEVLVARWTRGPNEQQQKQGKREWQSQCENTRNSSNRTGDC